VRHPVRTDCHSLMRQHSRLLTIHEPTLTRRNAGACQRLVQHVARPLERRAQSGQRGCPENRPVQGEREMQPDSRHGHPTREQALDESGRRPRPTRRVVWIRRERYGDIRRRKNV
jgi:hypothetical protein